MRRLPSTLLGLALSYSTRLAASPFYELHALAKTGDPAPGTGYTFKSFTPSPSINNDGQVAFVGPLQNPSGAVAGEGLSLSNGTPGSLEWVSSGDAFHASKTIGSVWINHEAVVPFPYRIHRAASPAGVRRHSQATGAWGGETIAKATTARRAITIEPRLGDVVRPASCRRRSASATMRLTPSCPTLA